MLRAADATARSNPFRSSAKDDKTFRSGGDWDGISVCPLRSSAYGRLRYWCL